MRAGRRGRCLACNRAITHEATVRFPGSVQCKTTHALAYAALGHRCRNRLNAPRRPDWQAGQALGITKAIRIKERDVCQRALSNTVLRTVTRFCDTAGTTPHRESTTPHCESLTAHPKLTLRAPVTAGTLATCPKASGSGCSEQPPSHRVH